jgi:cytosine/adenosine deaminase-related metal-dependent hydrolase
MKTRLLTATRIHDGRRFLPEGTVLEVEENGTIVAVHDEGKEGAQWFEGILLPGFVNAHCHLELSHMQGMISPGTGLIPFLQQVQFKRGDFTDEQKKVARHEAYAELVRNGVVAVGDIVNTTDTVELRRLGAMHVQTFVECIGFTEAFASARLAYSQEVLDAFRAQPGSVVILRESIVPHAPYSVSSGLFNLINEAEEGSLISIHNQESAAEDEYYLQKTGDVRTLLSGFGIDDGFFEPSGLSSLQTYLPWIGEGHPMLFVHNTFSSAEDVAFAMQRKEESYWCLCPGANLYIEGRVPPVMMLAGATDKICVGTDSLASNTQLSIWAELLLLKEHFPELDWEVLIRWGTANGAAALRMDNVIGSFSQGLRPGVVQLSSLDPGATIKRIM